MWPRSSTCSARWWSAGSRKSKSVSRRASNTEFNFNRRLIEDKRIPDDVTIQCLVQAREDLIEKTVAVLDRREERGHPHV